MVGRESWHLACLEALEHSGVGVLGCDRALRIVGLTSHGATLVAPFGSTDVVAAGDPLPAILERAARTWLDTPGPADRQRPVRLQTRDGRFALYVSFVRSTEAGIHVLVLVRREIIRDAALLDALRRRANVSPRDFQVITLVRQGQTNKQIAQALDLAPSSVKAYLYRIFEALGIHSRAELIALVEDLRVSR